ncbi:MAG: serine/threonine protein kinase, partial [Burkholderiales bacterium]|nr:serine/threonine protein kinase [Burkholderiales bacterium]
MPAPTGPDHPPSDQPNALPAGARLGEFEVRGVIGIGGFGIVYRAFDHALEREVAIKEYMPAALAGRTQALQVSVRSQADAETFALGLKSFVQEARLLAQFDHPSLVKVLRFWQANGTAYMAMPVLQGRTLKQLRQAMSGAPGEAWLRQLLEALLGAVERLHAQGVYHRDISPDNILVEPDGRPVLLDFGAARRVIGDQTHTLTAILKPAYAPIEQYAEAGAVRQGPWTDLYALGATLHYLMLGRPPPPATARTVHDEPLALTAQALPGLGDTLRRTVTWMLAPRPADRPHSVAAVRDALAGRAPPSHRALPVLHEAAAADAAPSAWPATVVSTFDGPALDGPPAPPRERPGARGVPRAGRPPRPSALPRGVLLGAWGL